MVIGIGLGILARRFTARSEAGTTALMLASMPLLIFGARQAELPFM